MIGEQFGDWRLDEELTAGPHGARYRATAVNDSARTAIVILMKELSPPFGEFESSFTREVLTLTKMSHPHLVAYYGGGIQQQRPYLVAEDVQGTDFQTLLRNGDRPTWQQFMSAALQLVSALRHAHRRGILHGDLKPENVLRTPEGAVKLAHCGLAKFHPVDLTPNNTNPLASAAFLSPEQVSGKSATKRSDFYSLGCLLYSLLTGRPPFTATNMAELIHKHCFILPERPTHFVPELPHEVDAFIMRLMAKDPQNRPGSGTLMLEELERLWALFEARGQLPKREPLPVDGPPSPLASNLKKKEERAFPPREVVKPPLLSRPWVLLPLFLSVVGLIVLGFQFTREDPEELFAKAEPLMQSTDPADWERAWHEYLEPLARRYPDFHAEQIKSFRNKVEPLAELRRAQLAARNAQYASEGERFYNMGLRLCQAGDVAGARRIWERTVIAFAGVEQERRWVLLSQQALDRTPKPEGLLKRPTADHAMQNLLEQATTLCKEGKIAEADAILDALESLYAAEPDFAEIRPLIQKARKTGN